MLYFFHGPETFLAHQTIKKISQGYPKIQIIDWEEEKFRLETLKTQLWQESLFEKKPPFLIKNLFKNLSEVKLEEWIDLFSKTPKTSPIIIWEQEKLTTQHKKFYSFLSQNAQVKEFKNLSSYQLKDWIKKEADAFIEPQAIEKLISLHGDNLWILDSELKKLGLYCPDKQITLKMVEKLCTPSLEENIFKFTEAFSKKASQRALWLLGKLIKTKVDANYILSMLARELRLLVLAKENALQKEHPFVQSRARLYAKNWQLSHLQKFYQSLTEIDYQSKKGAALETNLTIFLGKL